MKIKITIILDNIDPEMSDVLIVDELSSNVVDFPKLREKMQYKHKAHFNQITIPEKNKEEFTKTGFSCFRTTYGHRCDTASIAIGVI